MNLIRASIENPVKVSVAVLLAALFGLLGMFNIPIQLTPNVDQPIVTVTTRWNGASPAEIENEIIKRQEEKLKSVSSLKKMTSVSRESEGEVTLEFHVGTSKDAALRDTIERVNQVSNYPLEVERPEIVASDSSLNSPIAWLNIFAPEGFDPSTLYDFVYDHVKPPLERVEGVARVDIYGGREREAQVRIDPRKLAARGLTFRDVEAALRRQNRNISAGTVMQGKRDSVFRTMGEFASTEEIARTIVAYTAGGPVYVSDVVRDPEPDDPRPGIEVTYKKRTGFVRSKGQPIIALPVRRETGANVVEVMKHLKVQIADLNRNVLAQRGLRMEQTYDETVYINSSIGLVRNNLIYGSILAIIVLMLFLRNTAATAVVAFAIPVSVITTFLVIALTGRSLNVVMLAGIAFAVGMVVDNSVVVLENIYRHRETGKPILQAALDGTQEVWGAVLASTLTTMAVFVPVLFIQEEAGQLFRDIAIAIAVAVFISLVVSVTVIPTLSARLLRRVDQEAVQKRLAWSWARVRERFARRPPRPGAVPDSGAPTNPVHRLVRWIIPRPAARLATIVLLTVASLVGSRLLIPPSSYLPPGNRNLVFGYVITPPGYSVAEFESIAATIEEGRPDKPESGLRRYWEAEPGSAAAAALPKVEMRVGVTDVNGKTEPRTVDVQPPPLANFFFVSWRGGAFMGAMSADETRVTPLVDVLSNTAAGIPGANAFFSQSSLFSDPRGSGNSVDLEIRGYDLDEVRRVAALLIQPIMSRFGYPRPDPVNFDLGRPEVQAIPDRAKAADLGLNVEDVGFIIRACVDGAYVGEYNERGDKIDLVLIVDGMENAPTTEIENIPIYTPTGKVLPLASAIRFVNTTGPQQINHIEEQPAVNLSIRVPQQMALQSAMELVENDIIRPMREAGTIPPSIITSLAGNADKLVQTQRALFGEWTGLNVRSVLNLAQSRGFLALIVTYLLMCALFESYLYPFVIMFSVPLATLGGFAGLAIVHHATLNDPLIPTQQLDVLTMLGFIVLVGIVVNNAILIVHQALNFIRHEGMSPHDAVIESVRTRTRPIFITSLTTVFGQLPLVVMPGAGSELYRGLGSVILGGLLVSTIFTLFLVPALFSLVMDVRGWVLGLLRGAPRRAPARRPHAPSVPAAPEAVPVAEAPRSS